MKRAVLIVLSAVVLTPFAAYAQTGLRLKVFGTGNLGIDGFNNGSVRGSGGGALVYEGLGILLLGLEAKAEYDAAYSAAAFPITLDLGLGDGFWIMAGTTLGASPSLYAVPLKYGGFLNTFGVGVQPVRIDLGFGHLILVAELTYTSVSTADAANNLVYALGGNDVEAALLPFTAYLGAGLEVGL